MGWTKAALQVSNTSRTRVRRRFGTGLHASLTLNMDLGRRFLRFFQLEDHPQNRILRPLFLVSFASLYLEIVLIRWMGTEVRVFAYFQNLALITCFLGFGLGCYQSAKKKVGLFDSTALGILIILITLPFPAWKRILENVSWALAASPNAAIWSAASSEGQVALVPFFGATLLVIAFLIFVTATMIPLGQWVGTYLRAAKDPVTAYSVNLLGSVAGIWAVAGMSFFRLPPELWFAIALLMFLAIRDPARRPNFWGVLLLVGALFLLRHAHTASEPYLLPDLQGGAREIHWSPYQKLEVSSAGEQRYNILVNNVGYMTIANFSTEFLAQHPHVAEGSRSSPFDMPFRFADQRDKVLILGAGAGNDAAAALRNGAQDVDAVEIDPVIYALGKRLHPEHPYSSPQVHVIVNDAREYMRRATKQYDVVLFATLDSHTQFSTFSNMRIDNYVYTEESFHEAAQLLKPTGILIIRFDVRKPWTWMGQRFSVALDHLFGRSPIILSVPQVDAMLSSTIFITSHDPAFWDRVAKPPLAEMIKRYALTFSLDSAQPPIPATDNWPYVYQRDRRIPRTYFIVSLILLTLAILLTGPALDPTNISSWTFFLLGAGFLLLETQLVSRLALYLGATWLVNCVVLSAILFVLVLANIWVVKREIKHIGIWYGVLIGSLFATYVIPWESLPFGATVMAALLSGAYCIPVFAAGVIFTDTFRACADKSRAFGSNIVGAVAGGLAQNVSFLIGLKVLLLIAAAFYAAAYAFASMESKRPGSEEPIRVRQTEA